MEARPPCSGGSVAGMVRFYRTKVDDHETGIGGSIGNRIRSGATVRKSF
jgi:hypothetical protein